MIRSLFLILPGFALLSLNARARADEPAAPQPAASVESRYLSGIRQLTKDFSKAGEAYFSPDGKQIVYQAIRGDYPFYQIYTQPLAGGEPKQISTGKGRTTCSYFSPDGKKILFASSHLDPNLSETEAAARKQADDDRRSGARRRYSWDFDPHMDLFEADLDGHIQRRLTSTPGYDAEGAYSADGKQIAFCGERDGNRDIYLMDSSGENVKRLTTAAGYDGGPFISPDGRWVVFRSDRKKAEWLQIYVIGVDGKGEVPLTDNQGVNWGPSWHPKLPYLIWAAADHSNPQLRPNYDLFLARYKVVEDKFQLVGEPLRITDQPGADLLPVFSPDGKQLMWTSTRTSDHSSQLFLADFQFPPDSP